MDHTSRPPLSSRHKSPSRDITAPRMDPTTRISKRPRDDYHASNPRSRGRNNPSFEDEQSRQWVAQEDIFVLKQAKKKAAIRVREGRAKPIDWLAVILRMIDPDRDLLDDDEEDVQMDVVDPEGVFEGLDDSQLSALENDITSYLTLETNKKSQEYWRTMQIICKDRRQKLKPAGPEGRAVSSVSSDVDKLLSPKTYEQLEALEKQIKAKLRSNEPIDTDYWEQLLRSLSIFKAKAKLKKVYESVIDARLSLLRQQQREDAQAVCLKLNAEFLGSIKAIKEGAKDSQPQILLNSKQPLLQYSPSLDPDSLLKLGPDDKAADLLDESVFLQKISSDRKRIQRLGYVPSHHTSTDKSVGTVVGKSGVDATKTAGVAGVHQFTKVANEDFSQATKALYERELARGVGEDEEIFAAEETVTNAAAPLWADKYRPRKPKYFNRVQMGYEWNKYNQTHYDHDNPPPKVVQGYKFNIFYPDLIDKTKAPTFRIIRENGRRRGESFAPAGEEDTCVIRFIAGPPYEDIAFRIVDKEWDYSAKRDRGFRSSFDKGILQLHFQYKKVYYRK